VIVETAPADDLYSRPIHPYTEALLSAIPDIETGDEETPREQIVLEGEVPSPIAPPSGCRFPRAARTRPRFCSEVRPPLADFGDGRYAACHHPLGGAVPVAGEEARA
jgi:oligopeptide/dipeptide ABC transporter ATP-binding protein